MANLSRRGVKILFLFAPGDIGLDAVDQEFTRNNVKLETFDGVRLRVMPEIDHMLSTSEMRCNAIGQMIEFLTETPRLIDNCSVRPEPTQGAFLSNSISL